MAVIMVAVGCSSTTQIESRPSGATVYINGEKMGTTPYAYNDTKIIGSATTLLLRKNGYEDFNVLLKRDEQIDYVPACAGFFTAVSWLWSMGYNDVHSYELTPLTDVSQYSNSPNISAQYDSRTVESNSTIELIKLKNLLDEGAITNDDFTTLKVKILSNEYNYNNSIADQIFKLKSMVDSNLLTKNEFNSEKNKLINKK